MLIGLAAWPRGATGQLAQSLADAIKAGGDLVAATVERRLHPVGAERLSAPSLPRACQDAPRRRRARGVPHRAAQGVEEVAIWEQMSVFAHTRWYGAEMLARQSVASPPPGAADLVDALVGRVDSSMPPTPRSPPRSAGASHRHRCGRRSTSTASGRSHAGSRRTRPGRSLGWRGVVDLLRTRALIAEITLSLTRLRDLVVEQSDSPVPVAGNARLAFSRG